MSDKSEDLFNVLEALKDTLSKSFVLTNHCATVISFLPSLVKDIQTQQKWYLENPQVGFDLLKSLRSFLNFANKRTVIDGTQRSELVVLRKAVILLKINVVREELRICWEKLQTIILSTGLSRRLGGNIIRFTDPKKTFDNLKKDFQLCAKQYQETFTIIKDSYQKHGVGQTAAACLDFLTPETISSAPKFEVFENQNFLNASIVLVQYILHLDPQEERLLSNVLLENFKPGKSSIHGRFGEIYDTQLDLRKGGKTDPLSLQVLSSDDICKLGTPAKLAVASELSLLLNFKHSSVLNIIGFTANWGHLYIALEPIDRTLKELLHGSSRCAYLALSDSQILSVISSLASATEFLHSKGLIHGDIRPENIYVPAASLAEDSTKQNAPVKLANLCYGLNHTEAHWGSVAAEEGIRYIAPEILEGQKSSYASDVYSLTIVLWELCQQDKKPFDNISSHASKVVKAIMTGQRPVLRGGEHDSKEPQWAVDLMKLSWIPEPFLRPTASRWRSLFERVISTKKVDIQKVNKELGVQLRRRSVNANQTHVGGSPLVRPRQYYRPAKIDDTLDSKAGSVVSGRSMYNSMTMTGSMLGRTNSVELLRDYHRDQLFVKNDDVEKIPKEEIEKELTEYYTEHDLDVLKNPGKFDSMVSYAMTNGLEMVSAQLKEDYNYGLKRFSSDDSSVNKKTSRVRRGFFTKKKNKEIAPKKSKKQDKKKKGKKAGKNTKNGGEPFASSTLSKQGKSQTLARIQSRSVASFVLPKTPDADSNSSTVKDI